MKYSMLTRPVMTWLMNLFVFVAELLLAIRVVVQFFVGDSTNSFVQWVYSTSGILLHPFVWLWNATGVEGRWNIDFPALLAMAVVPAVGYGILTLVAMAPKRR